MVPVFTGVDVFRYVRRIGWWRRNHLFRSIYYCASLYLLPLTNSTNFETIFRLETFSKLSTQIDLRSIPDFFTVALEKRFTALVLAAPGVDTFSVHQVAVVIIQFHGAIEELANFPQLFGEIRAAHLDIILTHRIPLFRPAAGWR